MGVSGKLTTTGQFSIAGFVDEEAPPIMAGLKQYWPLSSGTLGRKYSNILPSENWVIGSTGSQTFFGQNGDGNQIIEDTDPWGRPAAVWQAIGNDAASNADGGWNSSQFSVDPAYTYRFTTWMKRVVLGNGSEYFGCHGYVSGTNTIRYDGSTSTTTNPYFIAGGWGYELDEWFLFVGHVWYDGYGGGHHVDSGVWRTNGTKRANISNDYQWAPNTTTGNHRSYLYYSTLAATDQRWCYPRVDKLDGTEPSLQDLIDGKAYGPVVPATESNLKHTIDGVGIDYAKANLAQVGYNTGWNNSGTSTRSSNDYTIGRLFKGVVVHSIEQLTLGNSALIIGRADPTAGSKISASVMAYFDTQSDENGTFPYIREWYSATNRTLSTLYWVDELGTAHSSWAAVPKNRWVKLVAYNLQTDAANDYVAICTYTNKAGSKVYFTGMQFEQERHGTSFYNGTPAGTGRLDLPVDLGTGNFTIFGKMIPGSRWDNSSGAYLYTANQSALFGLYDIDASKYLFLRYYAPTTSSPFIDPDPTSVWTTNASGHIHVAYTIDDTDTVYFAIRRVSSTNIRVKLWQAGSWKGEHSLTSVTAPASADLLTFGDTTLWEGVRSDIMVYNRNLSDNELDTLINHALSITRFGDLHNTIEESSPTEAMKMHRDGVIEIDEIIEGL
jgi:hypothetical protein